MPRASDSVAHSDVSGVATTHDEHVCCSICGSENVHMESVGVHQDRSLVIVDRRGAHNVEAAGSSGRGSTVEIRFACEDGCRFALRYQFHKGRTILDSVPRERWEGGAFPSTLWRD